MDDYKKYLPEFPANVFKPHGRKFAAYLFMRWNIGEGDTGSEKKKRIQNVREFICSLDVTNHNRQTQQKENKYKESQETLKGLFLTYRGFQLLGLKADTEEIPGYKLIPLFTESMLFPGNRSTFHDSSYRGSNSKQNQIDENYIGCEVEKHIHAMLMIAHPDKKAIEAEIKRLQATGLYQTVVESSFEEWGERIVNYLEQATDPLGFRDDLSNESDEEKMWKIVSCQEPPGNTNETSYGTFFVFRKIEVNENYFEKMVADMANKIVQPGMDEKAKKELACALYMGRFRDGTPVVQSNVPTGYTGNEFSYDEDTSAIRCPMAAHIRIVNPRTGTNRAAPIIRRSMTYKEIRKDKNGNCHEVQGLFFMSYQSDLNALKKILKRMEGNKRIRREDRQQDAIVYRPGNEAPLAKFPKTWDEAAQICLPIGGNDLTIFRGGECFFAPSTAFIKRIKEMPIQEPELYQQDFEEK